MFYIPNKNTKQSNLFSIKTVITKYHPQVPLGGTTSASVANVGIEKSIHESGSRTVKEKGTTFITSNKRTLKKLGHIMKIFESMEESGILTKDVTKTTKNETKEHKGRSFVMLRGTLDTNLLENMLIDKGLIKAGKRTIRASEIFHSTTSFN